MFHMSKSARIIDDIAEAVAQAVPAGFVVDVKQNLRAALRSAFDRMDLVTREELEVQEAVLRRTRERLEQLERQVAEMEQKLLKK